MSKLTKDSTFERRIEDVEKDIVSVTSGETRRTYPAFPGRFQLTSPLMIIQPQLASIRKSQTSLPHRARVPLRLMRRQTVG